MATGAHVLWMQQELQQGVIERRVCVQQTTCVAATATAKTGGRGAVPPGGLDCRSGWTALLERVKVKDERIQEGQCTAAAVG